MSESWHVEDARAGERSSERLSSALESLSDSIRELAESLRLAAEIHLMASLNGDEEESESPNVPPTL